MDFNNLKDNFKKYASIKSNLLIHPENQYEKNYRYTISIPTYKRPKLLIDTIESCLNQTYKSDDWQIIIVDNDPELNNETEKALRNFIEIDNLFYYKNAQNIGMFGNWNRCIELAQGDYILILSDDDLLKHNYLYEIDKVIKDNPEINMIYSYYDYFGTNHKSIPLNTTWYNLLITKLVKNRIRQISLIDFFLRTFGFSASGMMFKRILAIQLGGHDDSIFPSSDYYFQSKFTKNFGNVFLLNKILASYRKETNESMRYEVCDLLPDIHLKIRTEMIEHIKLPSKVLSEISLSQYKKDLASMLELYGHDFSKKTHLIKDNNSTRKIIYFKLIESLIRKTRMLGFLIKH